MRTYLLSHLLEARALQCGRRAALAMGGETTSYGDLKELSARLAATLAARGLGHRDRIGVYLPKGLAAYVSIFAALELGAAYVPLDPSAPPTRIRETAGDCALKALITTAELAGGLAADVAGLESLAVLVIAGTGAASDRGSWPAGLEILTWEEALEPRSTPAANSAIENDLAYVLYTSGSTGRPKGVMISHRGALAFVDWAVDTLGLTADDRVAGVAALHFDLSILDLFATVAAGATLWPLPPGILLTPRSATAWIAENAISVWYSTPSTLILLLEQGEMGCRDYPDLRLILFAGEVFPTKHLRRLRRLVPRAELYNLYGPTETNVCVWKRVEELPAGDHQTLAIGRACANTEVAALDAEGREAAAGEEGELWVRGPTVMRGYWDDREKGGAVLRRRPDVTPGDDLWFRTGDFVHRDASGDYHFHGRRDHMVKIRGYRVELGEVESALYAHPNVRELAVVTVPTNDHGVQLRAYVVPGDPARHSPLQIKAYLGERLPPYMIPAEIVCTEALPKTSTGKVDRRALAADARGPEQRPG